MASSTSSAIRVAHTGTPRTKFLVPSIGSITQCLVACGNESPNSSPTTASSGRSVASRSRIARSTARSASDTGLRSGLASTRRSADPNRARLIASAASASRSASARSSVKGVVTGSVSVGRTPVPVGGQWVGRRRSGGQGQVLERQTPGRSNQRRCSNSAETVASPSCGSRRHRRFPGGEEGLPRRQVLGEGGLRRPVVVLRDSEARRRRHRRTGSAAWAARPGPSWWRQRPVTGSNR